MTVVEEVVSFARDYINNPANRTEERKQKIRKALRHLTGQFLNFGCSTCYIDAVFKILNITKMASSKYELKKGVVLQVFGDPKKTCTNATITDELGDWYMKNHPEKMVFFVRYPKPQRPVIPPKVKILPEETKVVEADPVAEAQGIMTEAIEQVLEPKPKRKPAKKKTVKKDD